MRKTRQVPITFVAIALLAVGGGMPAFGDFVASAGMGSLSAQAVFSLSSGNLIITLTNTSTADVMVPADVLTALFFTIPGDPLLTPLSAVVAAGSTVLFGGTDPGGVVGGEWAYNSANDTTDWSGTPYDANQGISSVGLDLFGPSDRFPGNNLQGPASPDGIQYGLTSMGDNPATGNTPVTGTNALIQYSVVFTLGGVPSSFELDDISDVSFQYGTSLEEPNIPYIPPPPPRDPLVPEPSTMALLGLGVAGMVLRRMSRNAM